MALVLVGLGEILWDLLPSGKVLGGAPANFAFHAQALGAEGIVVSCVGDDEAGQEILHAVSSLSLSREYVFTDMIRPTGAVCVDVDQDGQPTYTIFEKVAWDFIPWNQRLLSLAEKLDAVCFGSLAQRAAVSRSTIHSFLSRVRPGTLKIFDINLRPPFISREVIETSLELTNILKINARELQTLAGFLSLTGNEEAICRSLLSLYDLQLVALTRGSLGSTLFSSDEKISNHPGFEVDVIDTVGAGDSFTAALAIGLLKGHSLDRTNENANRVASYVCTQSGATSPLPSSMRSLFEG